MGSCNVFLLQMQPNLVAHLKLMWHLMLIMTLFILSIIFIQDIMKSIAYLLNVFNKIDFVINSQLNMSIFFLCSCKRHCNINGIQWLKSKTHLKWVTSWAMESFVLVMLKRGETLIPCSWMIGVLHVQYVHYHLVDDLCLPIILGVEGSWLGELGIHHWPKAQLECA